MASCFGRGRTSTRPCGRCASASSSSTSFAFALPSLLLTLRLARPDARPGRSRSGFSRRSSLLAAGVVVGIVARAANEWMSRLVGHECRMHCTTMIPMLAAPILAALIVALRAGAPLHPALTGALAGAASAGVAALSLRLDLPGQFAFVRGDLVSARDPHLRGRRRAGRQAVSGLVRALSARYFLISGSRIALNWSMVSSPP